MSGDVVSGDDVTGASVTGAVVSPDVVSDAVVSDAVVSDGSMFCVSDIVSFCAVDVWSSVDGTLSFLYETEISTISTTRITNIAKAVALYMTPLDSNSLSFFICGIILFEI